MHVKDGQAGCGDLACAKFSEGGILPSRRQTKQADNLKMVCRSAAGSKKPDRCLATFDHHHIAARDQ